MKLLARKYVKQTHGWIGQYRELLDIGCGHTSIRTAHINNLWDDSPYDLELNPDHPGLIIPAKPQ